MAASPSPLRIGSACIVAFPHHWQAKNDRVIFQVETWFMFHYWMRRGLASTSPRKPKGVTRGRPPHGRVFMRPFARPLRRAIFATSAFSMIAFAPTAFAQEAGATDANNNEIIVKIGRASCRERV